MHSRPSRLDLVGMAGGVYTLRHARIARVAQPSRLHFPLWGS